jgi:hypothetical protein
VENISYEENAQYFSMLCITYTYHHMCLSSSIEDFRFWFVLYFAVKQSGLLLETSVTGHLISTDLVIVLSTT